MESGYCINPTLVTEAYERIKDVVYETPILTSKYFNDVTGKELHFKVSQEVSRRLHYNY